MFSNITKIIIINIISIILIILCNRTNQLFRSRHICNNIKY